MPVGSTTQGAISYLWSTTETTSSISVATPGTYTVTITDADNGCTDTQSQNITQDALTPTADINPSITELTCANTSATLDASGSTTQGAISYLWSTTETTSSIAVATPGTYTVTITDADNGCTDTQSQNITQDINTPTADINPSITELTCANTSATLGCQLDRLLKELFLISGPLPKPPVLLPLLLLGTYTVTITDADNGCTDTQSQNITQDALLLLLPILIRLLLN